MLLENEFIDFVCIWVSSQVGRNGPKEKNQISLKKKNNICKA